MRAAAVLALLAGAACASIPNIDTPLVSTTSAPNAEIAEIEARVPRGMGLAVTSGPAPDPATPPETAPDAAPDEGGAITGTQAPPPPHPPQGSPAPSSPEPSGPDPALPTFAEEMARELLRALVGQLPEPVDVLELIRLLTTRDEPEPAPAPEPVAAPPPPAPDPAPAPPAEATAESFALREFMGSAKGGWTPEQEAAAVRAAEEALGYGFASFPEFRRNAWIAACHFIPNCDASIALADARAAAITGAWDAAADEVEEAVTPYMGPGRAAVVGNWLRTEPAGH